MGSMGSSGAIYHVSYKTCPRCKAITTVVETDAAQYCHSCYEQINSTMVEPSFSLQDLEASKDFISKLSNS